MIITCRVGVLFVCLFLIKLETNMVGCQVREKDTG
jgi:hypothetical protein